MLSPENMQFHPEITVQYDSDKFSDRIVKITIPKCAQLCLEINVFVNELQE